MRPMPLPPDAAPTAAPELGAGHRHRSVTLPPGHHTQCPGTGDAR